MSTATETVTKKKTTIKEPEKFKVVFHNDDHTPMEFVIQVLMLIFRHNEDSAKAVTVEVHESGKGIAGVYFYEIAEQKATETIAVARNNGFPLAVTIEKA